jgi:hypothetical protein
MYYAGRGYLDSTVVQSLEAQLSENGDVRKLWIYVESSDMFWKALNSADDIDGNRLNFQFLRSDVITRMDGSSIKVESAAVYLSNEYLNRHRVSGINIQLSGRSGKVIIKLSPSYVDGFLQAIERLQKPKNKRE